MLRLTSSSRANDKVSKASATSTQNARRLLEAAFHDKGPQRTELVSGAVFAAGRIATRKSFPGILTGVVQVDEVAEPIVSQLRNASVPASVKLKLTVDLIETFHPRQLGLKTSSTDKKVYRKGRFQTSGSAEWLQDGLKSAARADQAVVEKVISFLDATPAERPALLDELRALDYGKTGLFAELQRLHATILVHEALNPTPAPTQDPADHGDDFIG
jgi:hypothetical protein